MKHTSHNKFKQSDQKSTRVAPLPGKKLEFPQPFQRSKSKRRTLMRYKTLPVTIAELSQIPESKPIEIDTSRFKLEDPKTPPVARSKEKLQCIQEISEGNTTGGETCDEFEKMFKAAEQLNKVPDIQFRQMSFQEKSLLLKKDAVTAEERVRKPLPKKKGSKRFLNRRKDRSRTQPVTTEEVVKAAEWADEDNKKTTRELENIADEPEEDSKEDNLSK